MNVATWAIREPVPPIVLFLLLILAGIYAFGRLNVQDMPDMEFPMVTVTAVLQGASPSQLETEVTRKIEDAVASIEGIEDMASTVTEGASTTMIQFVLERDVFEALNDVRAAVSNIRADLPRELEEPIVSKVNASGEAILTYTVESSSMDEEALSWFVDNTVARKLTAIPGLATVSRLGGVNREIRVELDPTQLVALGVSAADVSRQLRQAQLQLSGGRGEIGDARQSLRTIATVDNARQLAVFDIALPGGRHFRLDQIATIHDTVSDRGQIALLDDQPVVAFQIQRSRDSNALAVGKAVVAAVAELEAAHPTTRFTLVVDRLERIEHEFRSSMNMLYEGAFLAMVVVFLFLRDWRATLVSAAALPLSIIPTFAIIYWMDFSLNTITMLALTLVIGLLVDDTIVEVENVVRHLRQGKTPLQAAMDAATEIGLAVVATTLTLVAVFLPTAFMGGIPGLFFRQFGWTAVIAVLASLAVARLLTPMLCSRLLRPTPPATEPGRIMTTYLRFAAFALRHRLATSACAALFFAASVAGLTVLPQEFVPSGDFSRTFVTAELPPGSSIDTTQELARSIRQQLVGIPEISQVFTTIGATTGGQVGGPGSSPFSVGDARRANLTVTLTPAGERERSQAAVENEIRRRLLEIPGARFTVGYGSTGERLQLNLTSQDADALKRAAADVMRDLRTIPGLGNVTSNASLLRPEVIIRPNLARAAELGVTTAAIGEIVQVATAGDYDQALAKMNLPERQVDIRVQLPFEARRSLETIEQLRVPGASGWVPLSAVADVQIGSGPAQISRFDRERNVQIDAELGDLRLGEASRLVDALPALNNLPAGVRKVDIGDAERMQEMFGSFGLAMVTGIVCVFMVLVLLFKDFMQPITILAALPLSIGGAVLALLLADASFSMPAVIGLLMLMGITTKNSILLVDYAVVAMRDHGMNEVDALLDACRKRARPIVMTTLAMAAGMVPVALGLDAEASFRAPLGIVVIGGLLTSTVLSLVVVPVVFTYVLRAERLLALLFRARHGRSVAAGSP